MKLLYLAYARLPTEKAHGLQIMKTCEALAREGLDVELVVPTRRNTLKDDPFAYYGVEHRFALTQVGAPDLVRFGFFGFILSLFSFAELARWRDSFKRADIIYSRDHLVLLNYLLLGRRLVFEAHAKPTFFSALIARRAYRVVVISRALEAAYRAEGVSAERLVLAPDAVDLARFAPSLSREEARAAIGLDPTARIVLYLGHLYARKGADTLAEAAALMSNVLVVFVGGTESDIAHFKKRWGSVANIQVEGHVSPGRVPSYLHAADLLVIPNSARDEDAARYSSPMKLFEYMASGTPILATDVPALREVLDEASAFFAAPDDPRALARAAVEALEKPEDARQRALRARALAERYSWRARARRIREVL